MTQKALIVGVLPDQECLDNAHIRPIVLLKVAILMRLFIKKLGVSVEVPVKLALISNIPLLFVPSALP